MWTFAELCEDYHSKNLQITSKLLKQGSKISKDKKKHLKSSSGHTRSFYPYSVKYRFNNMFLKESLTRSSTVV